ncbi:hypothetical protein BGZ76_001369 [Entomortierella beljakovae]|nr:hypothetical protein BGZ76_001369 [Entomortierella beljakovae]
MSSTPARASTMPVYSYKLDSNEASPAYVPESFPNSQPYNQKDSEGPMDIEEEDDEDEEDDSDSIIHSNTKEKRIHDFHTVFKSIPQDEKLIRDYGCALQKEILVQGRLYVSENHVCFNASIFGWVTNLVIAFSEITAIEKRFTAYVIPNAISIVTANNTRGHFFASFLNRDSAYDFLMAAWRKSFPCPANSITAEEQIIYSRPNRSSTLPSTLPLDTAPPDDDDGSSFVSKSSSKRWGRRRQNSSGSREDVDAESTLDNDSKSIHNKHKRRSAVRKMFKSIGKHDRDYEDSGGVRSFSEAPLPTTSFDDRKRDSSEPMTPTSMEGTTADIQTSRTDAEGGKNASRPPTTCKCSKDGRHYATTFLSEIYPGSVESIWKLLFESNFNKSFLSNEVMKGADVQEEAWKTLPDGQMTRVTKYIKWLGLPIGPKTTKATLTDTCEHKDFDDYVTDVTSTSTPDVPSGGSFTTKVRTCITWAGPNQVKVVVTGGTEFTKSSWIKGQIEKGATEGLTTHYKEMNKSIRKYISEHPAEFGSSSTAASSPLGVQPKANKQNSVPSSDPVTIKSMGDTTLGSATSAPAGVQSTEEGGLLSTLTSMLPLSGSEGSLSNCALIGVLLFIMFANVHIWRQISNVTLQIEKVHVDVIAGQHQHRPSHKVVHVGNEKPKSVHRGSGEPTEGSFTREQEEAMWAWLTERDGRQRQYQQARDQDVTPVEKFDGSINNGRESKSSASNFDILGAEARLLDRIDDLQKQLEALERSLELGSQGM